MISQSIPILRINEIPYCTWKECLQIDVMFLRKVFIFQSCNHRKSMTYRQNYVRIMSERTKYEKTNNGPLSNIWTLQIDGELHKRSRRVIGSCSNIYTRRVNHVKYRDLLYMYAQKIRIRLSIIEKIVRRVCHKT